MRQLAQFILIVAMPLMVAASNANSDGMFLLPNGLRLGQQLMSDVVFLTKEQCVLHSSFAVSYCRDKSKYYFAEMLDYNELRVVTVAAEGTHCTLGELLIGDSMLKSCFIDCSSSDSVLLTVALEDPRSSVSSTSITKIGKSHDTVEKSKRRSTEDDRAVDMATARHFIELTRVGSPTSMTSSVQRRAPDSHDTIRPPGNVLVTNRDRPWFFLKGIIDCYATGSQVFWIEDNGIRSYDATGHLFTWKIAIGDTRVLNKIVGIVTVKNATQLDAVMVINVIDGTTQTFALQTVDQQMLLR